MILYIGHYVCCYFFLCLLICVLLVFFHSLYLMSPAFCFWFPWIHHYHNPTLSGGFRSMGPVIAVWSQSGWKSMGIPRHEFAAVAVRFKYTFLGGSSSLAAKCCFSVGYVWDVTFPFHWVRAPQKNWLQSLHACSWSKHLSQLVPLPQKNDIATPCAFEASTLSWAEGQSHCHSPAASSASASAIAAAVREISRT